MGSLINIFHCRLSLGEQFVVMLSTLAMFRSIAMGLEKWCVLNINHHVYCGNRNTRGGNHNLNMNINAQQTILNACINTHTMALSLTLILILTATVMRRLLKSDSLAYLKLFRERHWMFIGVY